MLGALLIAPLLLLLASGRRELAQDKAASGSAGGLAALGLLLAVTGSIYSGWMEEALGLRHATLLVLPPAVWLALRYPMVLTLFGNLAVVLIADIGTSLGHGPFSDHTSGLPLLNLVFVATTLLMAASQRERALATAEVHRLATRDPLTDLPNRNLLALRLETALANARRYQQRVGVLFIDLDHFKRINDSLGHAVGDHLLVAATERIASVLRADSLLARVGGDEFVAVTERLNDPDEISRAAARVISALDHPFEIGPHVLTIGCSVGVAAYPEDGATGTELIKHADIAMYQAKSGGRGQFRFFSPAMNDQVKRRLEVENGLRAAMQSGSMVLHYQAIVEAASGRLQSVEALLRWRRPDGTLVMPGEFIHVAEETGLIVALGEWAIQEAARQTRTWREAGLVHVPVCVNLSARQLRHAQALSEYVRRSLREQGLDGSDLVLEITESMLLHLGSEVEEALRQLSHHGITLALDDFGTGYSSLGYLARLPINTLKIDRSFVREMLERPEARRLVRAMIELAHLLDMRVVAEGVENAEQRADLLDMGADALQGHVVSPAMAASDFARIHLADQPDPHREVTAASPTVTRLRNR
jgi:diguanylate cyclase (GGDEF)-like protein